MAFGILTLISLGAIVLRRLTTPKVKVVTTTADWLLYVLLLIQVISGVYIAIFRPWGSSWFAASATPYLWSLIKLNPEIGYLVAMPLSVKLHIVNAFVVIGFFPLHPARPHPGGAQPLSLAAAAGGAVEP